MTSEYDSMYSSLLAHLIDLKPLLISTDDEITKLLSTSTSDEMNTLSTQIGKGVDSIHSIIHDYRSIVDQIKEGIEKMDNAASKAMEQHNFDDKMESTDGGSGLPLNLVSLTSMVSKMESRFTRCLNTASLRISALARVTNTNPSIPPSIHPSSPNHSNAAMSPAPSTDSCTIIQTLIDRITTIESNSSTNKPNLSLPPIKLESFDGTDITRWPAYKYQIDQLILNNPSLNEVEKSFHVRSSLKGAALSLVSAIPTQKDFLSKIMQRLELEYSRSNLTQATLLQSLLRIRSKSTRLEDQIDAVRTMINLVQTIDEDCGINGLLTQQQLVDRIHPRFIAFVWKSKPATLLSALELIEEQLRSEQEEATITDAISERKHPFQTTVGPHFNSSGSKSQQPRTGMGSAKVPHNKQSNKFIPMCVFCGSHAYSADCTTVKSSKDRKNILRAKSLCFCCFSSQHSTANCNKKCTICSEKHHKAICDKPSPISLNALSVEGNQPERLFTAKAKVANPINDTVVSAHVHLDHGAQATLITRDLVNRLALVPSEQREMTISGINENNTRTLVYDIVHIEVVTSKGRIPIEAVVQESTSVNSIHTHPLSEADLDVVKATLGTIPKQFSRSTVVHTDLLLSVGATLELLENAKETKLPCGYRLVQSSIGPLVVGSNKARNRTIDPSVSALSAHSNTVESLEQKIERLFSVDPAAREYETTEKEARKASNELANKHFEDTIEKQGDEYVVQYSIKPEAATVLPSNYDLAVSRLSSTIRTLTKQRSHLEFYNSIIDDQLTLGQIEKVDPTDDEGIVHYLAHQPVIRPDKPTTPLRIVYDASAHLKNKPSLNDMIHPGESDLERIPALLIRARSRRSLIIADVEKAFLQVKLHPSQRNMLRFLWIKDIDKPVTRQNILVLRFCVTPFGVNASPSLLNKVILHHLKFTGGDCDSALLNQLVTNLYVDNIIINVDHPTPTLHSQSKNLFETMSMNLRDYASNNSNFNRLVPESDRSKEEVQKLLGLLWNTKSDQLSIKIPTSIKDGKMTKRSMLSSASSPYDPLGLLNPLILPARLTIQNLWNTSLKWDEPVDDSIRETFHHQMSEVENFSRTIDRFSHLSDCDEIILIAFSDASKAAMATCVYSWSPDSMPTLLISKTRLAPIKSNSTIPKMELESLVMSHSLIRFTVDTLRKEFTDKTIHVFFYSDSAVALHWCKPEFSKPLGVFVSNRIQKINDIREELSASQSVIYHHPRHVRSEHNPADHATRGLSAREMNDNTHQWWIGPEWMRSSPSSWPNESLSSLQCPNFELYPMTISTVVISPTIEKVIDLTRFSSLRKAISVTANVYRFVSRCALKTNNQKILEKLSHLPDSNACILSPAEKRFAFNSIVRVHQSLHIRDNDPLKKSHSIFEDPSTNLWRSHTRLSKSNLNSDAKSPLFIPSTVDSTLAKLIIRDIHHSSSHSNIEFILNQVKVRFWIPRCRQIAKSVLKQCISCRKTNNLPFRYSKTPALPPDRVRQSLPFAHTGIDYAGPFLSNKDEKMYIVLLTCFSSRLSHLELVDSLLPSSFILAFKRFCSRRGTPTQITSDKATTFKMGSTLFTKPEEDPEVNTLMSNLGITWNFTSAHSPWKGGIYERLVKIIKHSITRSIGRKKLSKDEFSTVVCEIEALLNSRPLTYVSSDDVHSFTSSALRPIDLISPQSFLGCPIILSESDGDYRPPEDENSSREAAIKQLKRSIDTVEAFWKRWHNEYLTTLRDCSSKSDPLHASRSTTIVPTLGSIVLVVDESGTTPRSSWKMAKILSLTDNSATLRSHAGRLANSLPLHSQEQHSIQHTDHFQPKEPTPAQPPRARKKVIDSAQMSSEIATFLLPEIANSLTPHLVQSIKDEIIPIIVDHVTTTIGPDLNRLVSDYVTMLIKKSDETKCSIHQLSKDLSRSIVNTPIIASHKDTDLRDHRITPTSSRTHSTYHRSTHRSRSRSPRHVPLVRTRSRSPHPIRSAHSRSPNRPYQSHQKKTPQCALCKGFDHMSKNCKETRSLSTRLSIMRSENRCMQCFRVLDLAHFPTCEPPLCHRGCKDHSGHLERHAEPFCPKNPLLTP